MRNSLAIAILFGFIFGVSLSAQDVEKPKELEVLGHYVGDWTSDVTNKPSVWNAEEQKLVTASHAEFVLDD